MASRKFRSELILFGIGSEVNDDLQVKNFIVHCFSSTFLLAVVNKSFAVIGGKVLLNEIFIPRKKAKMLCILSGQLDFSKVFKISHLPIK